MGFGVKMNFRLKLIKARETQNSYELNKSAWLYDLVLKSRLSQLYAQFNISVQAFDWTQINLILKKFRKSPNIFSTVDQLPLRCTNTILEMDLLCEISEPLKQSLEKCRRTFILNTLRIWERGANEL